MDNVIEGDIVITCTKCDAAVRLKDAGDWLISFHNWNVVNALCPSHRFGKLVASEVNPAFTDWLNWSD